ncbi:hypothetical protein CAOG_08970 [Capsaspora owczarzaki ATCC 30864]|nr:hypothetical protein CAOG_08970 [Capsaspora owczarzaki ATCC 30864]|eukprot:XP_011270648.1 hypothetical protein CAOG_08970 [Capsaspora owczarzaki ATCC 30864]
MLWAQITNFMVLILIAAAAVSCGIGDYKAGITLFAVVVINVATGFSQDYKAEKALDALLKFSVPVATVVRNGVTQDIPAAELVPGDVVVLEEGDQIPADLRLIEAVGLSVVEAPLTGEPVAVEKNTAAIRDKVTAVGDRINLAFMSTVVNRGRGRGVVVCIGTNTEIGRISTNITQSKPPQTPLQSKLDRLGKILVAFAVVLCGLVIGIGIGRGRDSEEMVKVGVSLAVSAIPEGLVAVTTVTMALGVQRMARNHAIVRKLAAVEALGSVTTICSDKTGTLTVGKMSATKLWTHPQMLSITGSANTPVGTFAQDGTAGTISRDDFAESTRRALMVCALCNNSSAYLNPETGVWDLLGDSTEVALNLAALKADLGKDAWTGGVALGGQRMSFVHEFAFDSDRKRMSVVYKLGDGPFLVLAKGAPEAVLKSCNFLESNGKRIPISSEGDGAARAALAEIEARGAAMAQLGLRVLALAIGERPHTATDEELHNVEFVEGGGLALVGLIGLMDPPRDGVQEAIAKCHGAGVKVSMITGDHPSTARAIALSLGIIVEGLHATDSAAAPMPRVPSSGKLEPTSSSLALTLSSTTGAIKNVVFDPNTADIESDSDDEIEAAAAPSSAAGGLTNFASNRSIVDVVRGAMGRPTAAAAAAAAGSQPPQRQASQSHSEVTGWRRFVPFGLADRRGSTSSSASSGSSDSESNNRSSTAIQGGIDRVLRGHEIDELMAADKLVTLNPFPSVFARVSPENKLQIVTALQTRGEVAAMTGDGVNDAAALRKSDCGVAMGIAGTDITKQAADIVLADDNFTTIVTAIEEGRRVYDNIRKFILYLLSCNVAEILCMLFAVIIDLPIPFTPLMILYANIVADIPPSIVLGFDSPEKDVMTRPPRDPKRGILTLRTIVVIMLQGASMCTIALIGLHVADVPLGWDTPTTQTFCFTLLTSTQLFHAFLSRSQSMSIFQANPFNNYQLLAAVALSFVFLIMGIYIPGFNSALDMVPLGGTAWAMILLGVFVHTLLSEFIKIYLRYKRRKTTRALLHHFQMQEMNSSGATTKPMFYNDL